MDELSPITFDQFLKGLDINNLDRTPIGFDQCGVNLPNISRGILIINGHTIYGTEYTYGPSCPRGLEDSLQWKKRNIFIWAEVNTGGEYGGRDDSSSVEEYHGSSLDFNLFIYNYLLPIIENILYNQANIKTAKQLCDILYKDPSIINFSDRRYDDYYGNYDKYQCYYITLEDLFVFLGRNEGL